MNKYHAKTFFLFPSILFCFVLKAWSMPNENNHIRPPFYYYKQLGINEGLSQSRVQCILNDHKGYLWIGTRLGLNRYDRDVLTRYPDNPFHDTPLSGEILFIMEDALLNLWVGTSKGLCRYDRAHDSFIPVVYKNRNPVALSFLTLDEGILFSGSDALYLYEYESKSLSPILQEAYPCPKIPHGQLLRYDEEQILLNAGQGIYIYDQVKKTLSKAAFLSENHYTAFFMDSQKRLWVSSFGTGLSCYSNGTLLKHFRTTDSPLTYDVIYDIIEKDNKLWVATDGGGINIISLSDFEFTSIQHIQDDLGSLPLNSFYSLYKDPSENIWLGSIRGGVIGIREVYARSFGNVPFGNPYGLSNQSINSFFQDSDGRIWIGTDGGGINRFDPETGRFMHYPATRYEKIVSIIEYSPDELMYFSYNKGIYIFNKKTGRTKPFVLVDPVTNDKNCINGISVNILRVADDKILFSGLNLFLYDIRRKTFSIAVSEEEYFLENSPLFIANKGTKTYLSNHIGISEYDSSTEQFTIIYKSSSSVNDACMDRRGVFWLATTEGVVCYNPQTREKKRIETELFKEATSIITDDKERIWIGTRHELFVYSTLTEKFAMMGETDGVLPNEYIFHAMLTDKSGNILIGGAAGMTIIDSNVSFNTGSQQTIELLDVLLNGAPLSIHEHKQDETETIKVPWDFSSLQMKVLLKEKDVFRKNKFRFRIKGLDRNHLTLSSNSLNINYLPIGKYTIYTSYYAQGKGWSKEQEMLIVEVYPPWWKSTWGYLAMFLLLFSGGYAAWYAYHKKRKQKELREIEKIENKINEEKINFLTNISHELRTPLTLICAPLKRIMEQKSAEGNLHEQLGNIYHQAYQMKEIIDMVLDVRKLEEGNQPLEMQVHPLNDWARSIGDKFKDEFANKGIDFQYVFDERIEGVPFDKNKCKFVLSNFLMNALKFSDADSKTVLRTELCMNGDYVRVSVEDEGLGLKEVNMDLLFGHFYQGFHNKGGSGIGLSYAKSIILQHNGRVYASPNSEKGAVFSFELPVEAVCETAIGKKKMQTEGMCNECTQPADLSLLKKMSVLIVEDTADLKVYLRDTMKGYFAHVYTAKDGEEGLQQARNKLPDIIVSDMMMPRMNGLELCCKIKNDLNISHIPFILLTAYHSPQNMNDSYKTGADAFLPKPFELDGLLALIYNQIKTREQIRLRYQQKEIPSLHETAFSNADETFLLKLNEIITDNINDPDLDVSLIADQLCISRSLLFSKLKALTGMGVVDYIKAERINRAVLLMKTTSLSLTEISEQIGFSTLRYFSRVFKEAKGIIPSEFKKQLTQDPEDEKE